MDRLCCCLKRKGKPGAGKGDDDGATNKVKGTVVILKKYLLDHYTDVLAYALDRAWEAVGHRISLQLISSDHGKLGKEAWLENWALMPISYKSDECQLSVTFDWDKTMGVPGAFVIKNHHHTEFFLKTLTLENVPGVDRVHFVCHSWVYPVRCYNYDRVFFSNKAYLPSETPEPLRKYREQELINLRGNGKGRLHEWDRTYDYAYYNDLGHPDLSSLFARPVLGGSEEYPYPRRGRTGRGPTRTDPNSEKNLSIVQTLEIYVPKDERFTQKKLSYVFGGLLKSAQQLLGSEFSSIFDDVKNFNSFDDIMKIFEGGHKSSSDSKLCDFDEVELFKELRRHHGDRWVHYPVPDVIKEDKSAWRTDEEFAREMLAGTNPIMITRVQEFPPPSKLDPRQYGSQRSSITEEDILPNMNGLSVEEAILGNLLFILDYHDIFMPYLRRINCTKTKTYATRTLLLLQDDGTLKPLAIELSLPHPEGDSYGAVSKVFTPAESGVEASVWQLAKAYVAVNDSGYHQLVSHWLNTHAVVEPYIIATHRHLSVLHPIYKLLHPHFRDTMYINALARQVLISAPGILEQTVFPTKYSMEMSAIIYKDWVFTDQALPADLLKRGVAVRDPAQPHGVRLLIEDYPYAADGLEIWSAIETWVKEYCNSYYPSDDHVWDDIELQSWWSEIRNVGHGDLKHKPWWPQMHTRADLVQICTIIIWTASAFHAAVNFGQYPYGGFLPNRPAVSRRFMPEPGTPEYAELEANPDGVFLKTITARLQILLGVTLIEVLSGNSTDEVFLGQAEYPEWTSDKGSLEAFDRFGKRLMEIEKRITDMNKDPKRKNRFGPIKLPYTLLYPNTSDFSGKGGINGKGIPNSISI